MLLEAKNISQKYKKASRLILDNVNLEVNEGDFISITGSSGSGKSTLLAIIGGYLKPYKGEVLYGEESLFEVNDKVISRLHSSEIGYVPQSNVVVKGLNVLENVVIPYKFSHKSVKIVEIEQKAKELLSDLGIGELTDRNSYELSGGELKRVALARALLSSPKILIADEPTTGLDKKTADIIAKYLVEYSKNGNAVIVATHDELIMKYGNRELKL